MIVYTDKTLVDLIPPLRRSEYFGGFECLAEYNSESLPENEAWYEEHEGTWWREVGRTNVDDVPYNLDVILEAGGLLEWLCDGRFEDGSPGVSVERNVAACIGEMAYGANLDPIEMVNTIAGQEWHH